MLSFVAMISLLSSVVLCQPASKESKGVDVTGTPEPLDITGTPQPKGGDMDDWDMYSTMYTPEPKGKGFDNTGDSMDDTDDSPDETGEPGEKGAKGSDGDEPGEKGAKGSDDDIDDILDYFNMTLPSNLTNLIDYLNGSNITIDFPDSKGRDDDSDADGLGNSVVTYGVITSFVVVALGWGVTMF